MAKKKGNEAPVDEAAGGHTVKNEQELEIPVTKTEEVVIGRQLDGSEITKTKTLKPVKVFDSMTLTHKTVWVEE